MLEMFDESIDRFEHSWLPLQTPLRALHGWALREIEDGAARAHMEQ